MKKFIHWLGIQDAFKKGLVARILVILCLLFTVFGAVFVAFRIAVTLLPGYPDAHWTDLLIESLIFASGVIALRFVRKDHMRAASRVILGALLIVVTLQAYFIGDPGNDIAGAMGLLLFAFLAILLLDRQDRWIAIFFVISVFIGLNLLSASGFLKPAISLDPLSKILFTFFVWLSVSIIIALVSIAAMGAMRREPQLLQQQIDESVQSGGIVAAQKGLPYLSTHDALTGLFNRLFLETEITRLENSRLYPISIIMVEIDELKKVNDSIGFNAGDQVLIGVARLLSKVFRHEDIISRYGGDDFAVILPNSNETIVKAVFVRINKQLGSYNKEHSSQPVSLNLGVSTANQGDSLKGHLKRAIEQLHQENLKKAK